MRISRYGHGNGYPQYDTFGMRVDIVSMPPLSNPSKESEKVLKAVANLRRLLIVRYLKRVGEATVTDIAREIHLSFRSTSRHLRVLANAGVLDKNQRSLEVYYCIAPEPKLLARSLLSLC